MERTRKKSRWLIAITLAITIIGGGLVVHVDDTQAAGKNVDIIINTTQDYGTSYKTFHDDLMKELQDYNTGNDVINLAGSNVSQAGIKVDTANLDNWYVFDHYGNTTGTASKPTGYNDYDGRRPYYYAYHGNYIGSSSYASTVKELISAVGGTSSNVAATDGKYVFKIEDVMTKKSSSGVAFADLGANAFNLKEHIWSKVDPYGKASMTFYGYDNIGYADFLFYPAPTRNKKTISFDIDARNVKTHSLAGAGFLVNAGIDGSGYIHGYVLFLEFTGSPLATGGSAAIYKINDNIKPEKIHDNVSGDGNSGSISANTACYTKVGQSIPFTLDATTKKAKMTVDIHPEMLSVKMNDYTVSGADTILGTDKPLFTDSTLTDTNYNGFGPYVKYSGSGHSCATTSYFIYSDLAMTYDTDAFEALRNTQITSQQDTQRFFINLAGSDAQIPTDQTLYKDGVARMQSNKIQYISTVKSTNLNRDLGDANCYYPPGADYATRVKEIAKHIADSQGWTTGIGQTVESEKPVAQFLITGRTAGTQESFKQVLNIHTKHLENSAGMELSFEDTSKQCVNKHEITQWDYEIRNPNGSIVASKTVKKEDADKSPPTYTVTKDSPAGSYSFSLKADDGYGVSNLTTLSLSMLSDEKAPEIAAAMSTEKESQAIFTLTDDNVGVQKYQINSEAVKELTIPASKHEVPVTLNSTSPVTLKVWDECGNLTTKTYDVNSVTYDYYINNTSKEVATYYVLKDHAAGYIYSLKNPVDISGKLYYLVGWSKTAGSTTQDFKLDTVVSSNMKVYGIWDDTTFKLTFNANGGDASSVPAAMDISRGANVTDRISTVVKKPTYNGYDFKGWAADTQGTAISATDTMTGPRTVYAKWTPASYDLKLDPNGGTVNTTSTISVVQGTSIKTALDNAGTGTTNPTYKGYNFTRWTTNKTTPGQTGTAVGASDVMAIGGMSVFAEWSVDPMQYNGRALADATNGVAGYTAKATASNGMGNYTYKVITAAGGATGTNEVLPGLKLNTATGDITGTPKVKETGTYKFKLEATDTNAISEANKTKQAEFTITVKAGNPTKKLTALDKGKVKFDATDKVDIIKQKFEDTYWDDSEMKSVSWDTNTAGKYVATVTYYSGYAAGGTTKTCDVTYTDVNPKLTWTTAIPAIEATDAENFTEATLLTYVNSTKYRAVTAATDNDTYDAAHGAAPNSWTAANFTAMSSGTYKEAGGTYTYSQTLLGNTLTRTLTVNTVAPTDIKDVGTTVKSDAIEAPAELEKKIKAKLIYDTKQVEKVEWEELAESNGTYGYEATVTFNKYHTSQPIKRKVTYTKVNPKLTWSEKSIPNIDATDTENADVTALTAYVNGSTYLGLEKAADNTDYDAAIGSGPTSYTAPSYTATQISPAFDPKGEDYTYSQTYLGNTLKRTVTVNSMTPTEIKDVVTTVKSDATDDAATIETAVKAKFIYDKNQVEKVEWEELAEDKGTYGYKATVTFKPQYNSAPVTKTVTYTKVNPKLTWTEAAIPAIDATDSKNADVTTLTAYVNGSTYLGLEKATDNTDYDAAIGAGPTSYTAPSYTATQISPAFNPKGEVYTYSQTYLGNTLKRTVTVNTMTPTEIKDVVTTVKSDATDDAADLERKIQDKLIYDQTQVAQIDWKALPEDKGTYGYKATVTFKPQYNSAPVTKTVTYTKVNPKLTWTEAAIPAIDATDSKNADVTALTAYVNGSTYLGLEKATDNTDYDNAIGTEPTSYTAPPYKADQISPAYNVLGATYTYTQTYLGNTLDRQITVNQKKQDLTVTADYQKYRNDPAFQLDGVSSQGGTVTYKLDAEHSDPGVVTVNEDGTVTITGVGEAKITATAGASGHYSPESKVVTVTVVHNKAAVETKEISVGANGEIHLNGTAAKGSEEIAYGFEWRESGSSDAYQHYQAGTEAGDFSVSVTAIQGMEIGKSYEYRTYVTTAAYGTSYGVVRYMTNQSMPLVTTGTADNITTESAILNGTTIVGAAGATEYGIQWKTPEENKYVRVKETGGASIYGLEVNNLLPGATYEYRAYAWVGTQAVYGEVATFTTEAELAGPGVGIYDGFSDETYEAEEDLSGVAEYVVTAGKNWDTDEAEATITDLNGRTITKTELIAGTIVRIDESIAEDEPVSEVTVNESNIHMGSNVCEAQFTITYSDNTTATLRLVCGYVVTEIANNGLVDISIDTVLLRKAISENDLATEFRNGNKVAVKLTAEELSDPGAREELNQYAKDNIHAYSHLYPVNLSVVKSINDGAEEAIILSQPLTVQIKVSGDLLAGYDYRILHQENSGTQLLGAERVTGSDGEEWIQFRTKSFSPFAVTYLVDSNIQTGVTGSGELKAFVDGNPVEGSDGVYRVEEGLDITFTADAGEHYHLAQVIADGESVTVDDSQSYTFQAVEGDHTITAEFAIDTYEITASAGAHGSISPAGTTTVNAMDSVTYEVKPDSGYVLGSLKVDGIEVSFTSNAYTFTNVIGNHTIEASFEKIKEPEDGKDEDNQKPGDNGTEENQKPGDNGTGENQKSGDDGTGENTKSGDAADEVQAVATGDSAPWGIYGILLAVAFLLIVGIKTRKHPEK